MAKTGWAFLPLDSASTLMQTGGMNTTTKPNLERVTCEKLFTGKYRYVGHFSNGAAIQLRESKHAYVAVAQLRYPPCNGGPAYSFSRKTTVALPKYSILQAQVQVEGGAAL